MTDTNRIGPKSKAGLVVALFGAVLFVDWREVFPWVNRFEVYDLGHFSRWPISQLILGSALFALAYCSDGPSGCAAYAHLGIPLVEH